MPDQISRRRFVWLCLGAAGAACTTLTGCSNQVAAEETAGSAEPTSATAEPTETFVSRCPKGLFNDPYPGRCGRYIDQNGDGICDLSQPS